MSLLTVSGVADMKKTFIDVRVFNPYAPSNRKSKSTNLEKKRAYEQRIIEVEHASFTPIVLSASGGLAKGATIFFQKTCHNARREVGPAVQHNYWLAQMYHLLQSATVCGTMFTRCMFVEGKGS